MQGVILIVLLNVAAVQGQPELQFLLDVNASINNPPVPGTSPGMPSWRDGTPYCQGDQDRQLLHALADPCTDTRSCSTQQ
jgi:hypothetical protein